MTVSKEEFLGEVRLGRTLSARGEILAGGAVLWLATGLLLASQRLPSMGSDGPVIAALAGLLLGLTVLSLLELLGGSGEHGGTYALIHETMGGAPAAIAGWSLVGASLSLFTAILLGASTSLLAAFPALRLTPGILSLILLLGLLLIQVFQILPGRITLRHASAAVLALFGAAVLSALPGVQIERLSSTAGARQVSYPVGIALMMLLYGGLDVILGSRRRVRAPAKNLPPALVLLVAGGTLFLAGFFFLLRLVPAEAAPVNVAGLLAPASFLPPRLLHLVEALILLLAAGVALMNIARQVHRMGRNGALPSVLGRMWRPFSMPPLIFAGASLVAAPAILWARTGWALGVGAGLFLVSMLFLNAADIVSHRTEPDRRRIFETPFHPLAPASAIAISSYLILVLPAPQLAGAGLWVLLGIFIYLLYGRRYQAEAQAGVVVFGRARPHERIDKTYRVLVPLDPEDPFRLTLWMAVAFARQMKGEVVPVQVIPVADPLATERGRHLAQQRNRHFRWFTRTVSDAGVPVYPITRLSRNAAEGIVDTAVEESCNLILLSWSMPEDASERTMGSVLTEVVRIAPCDVAVLSFPPGQARVRGPRPMADSAGADSQIEEPFDVDHILVPTAGGPHAPLAFRLAVLLAREYEAEISSIHVVSPEANEDEVAEGETLIRGSIGRMRELWEDAANGPVDGNGKWPEVDIQPRVVRSRNVAEGIAEASKGNDLVFLGASEDGLMEQVLFGEVAQRVASATSAPVVMVKRYRGLPRFWLRRAWETIFGAFPTLTAEERVEVYVRVRRDARPDIDFFIMMGLSGVIATFGLMQDNAAVIIGSMLVAPLFTPILAMSLGIVHGDIRMIRVAFESSVKGVALAIGLAFSVAWLSPLREQTPQILLRTAPNLFDLAVALASGAAGAYAVSRRDVAAALPGVAIAAALVPPLGVVGFGLATGELDIAGGSALLVTTNLIAITLAGSVTLLLLGFRPTRREEREARLRLGLLTSLALLALITIPLAVFFGQSIRSSQTQETIQRTLEADLAEHPEFELVDFEFRRVGAEHRVWVTVSGEDGFSAEAAEELSRELRDALRTPIFLEVETILGRSVEASAP